ncbi:hypothetical protein BJX66DRAFT_344717 [Aspergillus keveii]|uniref:histidine kinase n=1 Tax=Aspergillus keveii TaxID=714993 RepID=A0ABR4FKC8_9EURO
MASDEQPNESARFNVTKEQELYRYLPVGHASFPFARFDDSSRGSFVPTRSRDNVLTSLAQLGAMRLGVERAIVSLFGPTHQYILAEATSSPTGGEIRLGCCILPIGSGVCIEVAVLLLSEPSEDPAIVDGALVILDAKKSRYIKKHSLVNNLLNAQFCAVVPIVAPRGSTIGSFGIFDAQPRESGLDKSSIKYMKHLAATVMEHLDTLQSKHQNRQAQRMIYGLGSFVEGKTTLRDSWLESQDQEAATERTGKMVEGQLNKEQQQLQETEKQTRQLPHHPTNKKKDEHAGDEKGSGSQKATYRTSVSGDKLPGDNTPIALLRIFSRAANLIRESIEVEGVAFLDARIGSFGGLVGYEATGKRRSSSEDSSSTPAPSPPDPEEDTTTTCRVLGSSTTHSSTINDRTRRRKSGEYIVREVVLKAMMNRYPHGKIFNYTQDGRLSDDSSTSAGPQGMESSSRKQRRRHQHDADDLRKALGGVRSIVFLPLWDSHKSRWLSGVLVWTNTPKRVFTAENELAYLRAFGNSVMAEVHRLDVEMAEKAKSDLVTSISHELRSPLHGILGTADILSDTAMNALQQGMVHTIESCGRTLLDTINHLLDFTYIDKFKQDPKLKKRQRRNTGDKGSHGQSRLDRDPPSSNENVFEDIQLDSVLEEVVESVFAGHSFYHHSRAQHRHSSNADASHAVHRPKEVTIIFDIQEATEWKFFTQAGCWRRILMNVFSNALKYTSQGYIYLGLRATESARPDTADSNGIPKPNDQYVVALTVLDTGQGIGTKFLRNRLFTAFSQENTLAPGSGLGLSIVHKALRSLKGSIEVSSEKDKGTEITIEVPLKLASLSDTSDGSSSSSNVAYRLIRNEAYGKSIGLLGFGSSLESDRDVTLFNSLKRVCEDWFHFTFKTVPFHGDHDPCDFYLMVHSDLDGQDARGNQEFDIDILGRLSPLIVICQSPGAAHKMFAQSRTKKHERNTIVEFISQPCGPRKLARTLELCIKQQHGESTHGEEETRWIEVPESSHLPLDIDTRDAPNDRMKISKLPAVDKVGSQVSQDFDTAVSDSRAESHPTPDKESPPERITPCALLVEDNAVNLKILVTYVTKEGWDCETARNGLEAVEKFRANPGKFILVIIDISMPVMNGFEASRTIRQNERKYFDDHPSSRPPWYQTRITALTGLDSAAAQKEAYASGIDTFLTKPIKRQDIRSLLEQCQPWFDVLMGPRRWRSS